MKTLNDYITEKFVDIDNYKVDKRKYEIIENTKSVFPGCSLNQIRALKTFKTIDGKVVRRGDLGGYVESESNLSQEDNCWITDEAMVYDNAKVYGDALIKGEHTVIWEDAQVYDEATVSDGAEVFNSAKVYGRAIVKGRALIKDTSEVYGKATVSPFSDSKYIFISGNSRIHGSIIVTHNVKNQNISRT